MTQWIITAVGPDRPGLVGELSGHLHAAGANLLDSRMANLRGQFALVLLIEAPETSEQTLDASLQSLAGRIGLRLFLSAQSAPPAVASGMPFRLKTYSMDQPGIVHRVAQVLQAHGVNIEDLSTKQESAAFAGTPLFVMEMHLTIPPHVAVRKLRSEVETLCDTLNCDVDLEPA